jgi:hypothetical protein
MATTAAACGKIDACQLNTDRDVFLWGLKASGGYMVKSI